MTNFGIKVKQLLEAKNITQKELAERANTTNATISRYVNGEREPKIDVASDIARALDVSVDYLLGYPVKNRIRELREAAQKQQKDLSADIGVSQPTISEWESGRKEPSTKNAKKLADYFGVTVDYLLGRPEKDPRDMDDDEFYASLTEAERLLLEYYRNASDEARRIVDRIVDDGLDDR